MPPKKWHPKRKVMYGNPSKPKEAHNVLNLSDKVKILDL
jgi:hypothetical protein